MTDVHWYAGARPEPAEHIQVCGVEECVPAERQAPYVVWTCQETPLRTGFTVAEPCLNGLLIGHSMYLSSLGAALRRSVVHQHD